jgi:hypothetical protein
MVLLTTNYYELLLKNLFFFHLSLTIMNLASKQLKSVQSGDR